MVSLERAWSTEWTVLPATVESCIVLPRVISFPMELPASKTLQPSGSQEAWGLASESPCPNPPPLPGVIHHMVVTQNRALRELYELSSMPQVWWDTERGV